MVHYHQSLRERVRCMVLEQDFAIEVLKVHNKQMLVGRVVGSNAILRFRFFKCLCLKSVSVHTRITVTRCEFSKITKMVNCHDIKETHFLLQRKKIN